MAFLSKYRKLRGVHDRGMREVEFNFGRMFHQLGVWAYLRRPFLISVDRFGDVGLYSHAVKHYERVLEMAASTGVRFLPRFRLLY